MAQLKITPTAVVMPKCSLTALKSGTWVKLLEPLSQFCYDEAMLLCPASNTHWLAWIPDYGEAILDNYHFYLV